MVKRESGVDEESVRASRETELTRLLVKETRERERGVVKDLFNRESGVDEELIY